MKKLFTVLFILFSIQFSKAQTFGNEWINYSQTYLKFKIGTDGLYRINFNTLAAAGVPMTSVTGANFQMFHNGSEVTLYVTVSGLMSTLDYIEFYAVHNDGWLDKKMYQDSTWQPNDHLSLINDTSTYFLTWNANTNHLRYQAISNNLVNHPPKQNYCWYNSVQVYGGAHNIYTNYIPGAQDFIGSPVYNSDMSSAEGYVDNLFYLTLLNKTLYTPFPYLNGPAASIKTAVASKWPGLHQIDVSVGGTTLGQIQNQDYSVGKMDITFVGNLIGNGTTVVGYNSAGYNNLVENGVAWVELKYPMQFNFDNQSQVLFALNASTTNQYCEVYNFNENGSVPVLYDLTRNYRLLPVLVNDTEKFVLPPCATERKLLLIDDNTTTNIHVISQLTHVHFTDFSLAANQGNFIIISNPVFFDDGNGNNYVDQYKQFKNSNGYQAIVVSITDLYDEFAYGVELHPLSIRNFTDYIMATWPVAERNMFLIGKAIEFANYNTNVAYRQLCFVPTWGYYGSDVLLTATNSSPVPRIPIGRIPVLSFDEVKNYYNKAVDFVAAQNFQLNNPPNAIENKDWQKQILHMGGGATQGDQQIFQLYLNNYKLIIEDTLFGGHVHSFFKNTSAPITLATDVEIDSLFDNGISLVTFFGHSALNSFDFDIHDPYYYHPLPGHYPVFVSNGCNTGNIYQPTHGKSDEWTLAQDHGAIGFLAAGTISISSSLYTYSKNFYDNISHNYYNNSIGKCMQQAVSQFYNQPNWATYDKVVMEQMAYDGDPSFVLNTSPLPDYVLQANRVNFIPDVITAGTDSFQIQVIVTNLGKAIDDSIFLDVTRTFPDGTTAPIIHQKIKAPLYIDTVYATVVNTGISATGLNQFNFKIDATDTINEVNEANNIIGNLPLLILSKDLIPVFPYEFSIVHQQGVTLQASTANAFASNEQYIIQIDTTELFNSPLKQQHVFQQSGGLASWTPNIIYLDSTVYYWRTSIDTVGGNQYSWHNTSFIYLNGSSDGWNQSHYFQYLKDGFANVELPATRKFKFSDDLKTIGAYNGVTTYFPPGSLGPDEPSYYINGVRVARWDQVSDYPGSTFMIAVFDSATGLQWQSIPLGGHVGSYGSFNPKTYPLNAFSFNANIPSGNWSYDKMASFIDSIPNGDYVLAMSWNNAYFTQMNSNLLNHFHLMGATMIDTISQFVPYVLFSQKGNPLYPTTEIVGDSMTQIIDTSFYITGQWYQGYIESPVIGPASNWQSLHWKWHSVELLNSDHVNLQLFGLDTTGAEILLASNILAADTLLNGIDANQFPYLKMRLNMLDTIKRTPAQLDYWRINYQPVPEAALSPNLYLTFEDTILQMIPLHLGVSVHNVSPYDMDSLSVKYIITAANHQQFVIYSKLDSLLALDSLHAGIYYSTNCNCFYGLNNILVEMNPYDYSHQPEQYHFNNLGELNFSINKDLINPLLDVTFDGIHILDGDLVSATPDIQIRLSDENKLLALNDTSLFNIILQYPNGSQHNVIFDGQQFIFSPADSLNLQNSNTAHAELKPVFTTDGTYQLIVQAHDRSGNISGDNAYRISFEVINKPMISDVLNYPNPFTTKTHFVFTITGSQLPQQMRIQIMTVTGRVVKEISMSELGEIHIGRNITDYSWDGTDEFGDRLANGLYLYRVLTTLNGRSMDHYETGADQYFSNGFGKMYLMR